MVIKNETTVPFLAGNKGGSVTAGPERAFGVRSTPSPDTHKGPPASGSARSHPPCIDT